MAIRTVERGGWLYVYDGDILLIRTRDKGKADKRHRREKFQKVSAGKTVWQSEKRKSARRQSRTKS